MLMKILGSIDILGGAVLLLSAILDFSSGIYIFFGIILLAKSSLGMLKDFASWVDFLSGIAFLFLMATEIPKYILVAMAVLLLQKGFFSFLGE